MSNNWIRGARCGVDNCRSRFYRSVDGRRICQYGHVNEGHIDYNDDDDDNFVVTKRLNIPSNTPGLSQASQITPGLHKDESKRKLYGAAGRELFYKCYQCVLKSQVKTLINDHHLPEVLEIVVKRLYVQYITEGLSQPSGKTSKKRKAKQDEDNDQIESEIDDDYNDSEEFSDNDSAHDEQDTSSSEQYQFHHKPLLINTLAICYLACRYLNLPIYLNDFVQWTITNKIPYMRASFNIPKSLRDRLQVDVLRRFEPKRPPFRADLIYAILKISKSIKLTNLEMNYEPLLFKIIKELVLPPQIYYTTKKFIEMKKIKFNIKKSSHIEKKFHPNNNLFINSFPETKLISIIITITKLYFFNSSVNPTHITYDWKKWKELLENLDLDQDDDDKNLKNVISSLLLSKDSNLDVINWDEKQTNKYLDWFTQKIVKTQTVENESISMKRLYDLFELPEVNENSLSTESESLNGSNASATEKAYRQLMESRSANEKLTDQEIVMIEDLIIENLVSNFGLTFEQMKRAVRANERELFNS